jgi:site-specific recombinase XerD
MDDSVESSFERLLLNLGSDKSRRSYKIDWDRYCRWLEERKINVVAARPRHVEEHILSLQEKGCERSTCGRALSVIRAVYSILVRDEMLETNPAREVKNPKFDSTPNTPHLNEEQVRQLLSLPNETWKERREHLVLCLLFGLGWRRSEIARMQVEDFVDGTVTGIVKGDKPLTVGVPAWLLEKIESWCVFANIEAGPLLPRAPQDKKGVSDDMVYLIVKDAAKKAGLKITPHGLRRTNITIGGELGVTLKERQLSVGHSSQSTTERYDKARDAAKNAPGQVFADIVGGVRGTGVTAAVAAFRERKEP